MFIVLFLRAGEKHIFSHQMSNGQIRTVCGKVMCKENTTNTLVADQVFPGICSNCSNHVQSMFDDDLRDNPRIARNSWQMRLENLRDFHYQEILGPAGPTHEITNRIWKKLNKAKRTLNRNKK
jgi:hypothetical protein